MNMRLQESCSFDYRTFVLGNKSFISTVLLFDGRSPVSESDRLTSVLPPVSQTLFLVPTTQDIRPCGQVCFVVRSDEFSICGVSVYVCETILVPALIQFSL